MIIKGLLDLFYQFVSLLTKPIAIPQLSEDIISTFNTFTEYLVNGVHILANYTHIQYLMALLGIIIAVDIGVALYEFVIFILKKIPFIGIS